MLDFNHFDQKHKILDLCGKAPVASAIFPVCAQLVAVKRFTNRTWIIEGLNAVNQSAYPITHRPIKFFQLLDSVGEKFDSIAQDLF